MARLSASERAAIPKSEFGVPSKAGTAAGKKASGSVPMPDANHARAALSLAHNAPASEQPAIRAKANRILGRSSALTEAIHRQT